jgi:ElaB/YqjD/DUF883 family membrane-anchored ribosome-binding protein
MAQQNMAAAIPTAGADYDAVVAQLAALRVEISKLAGTVSDAAGHRGQALAADVSDGMAEAVHYLGRQARDGEARFEGAVATHPYVALCMAAGVGLLLGALTRR